MPFLLIALYFLCCVLSDLFKPEAAPTLDCEIAGLLDRVIAHPSIPSTVAAGQVSRRSVTRLLSRMKIKIGLEVASTLRALLPDGRSDIALILVVAGSELAVQG